MFNGIDAPSKSMRQTFYEMIGKELKGLYIGAFGRIVSLRNYEKYQTADIELVIKEQIDNYDATISYSQTLKDIRVALPRFGKYVVNLPPAIGDLVWLSYATKDIGDFLDTDGKENILQSDNYRAERNDCIAFLCGGTRKNHNNPSTENLEVKSDTFSLVITPEGVVNMEGSKFKFKADEIELDTPETLCTGNLKVEGNVNIEGTTESTGLLTAKAGVYAASYAGIGGGAATFNVDMNVTGAINMTGTFTLNGIVVDSHTHIDAEGRPTGGMQ